MGYPHCSGWIFEFFKAGIKAAGGVYKGTGILTPDGANVRRGSGGSPLGARSLRPAEAPDGAAFYLAPHRSSELLGEAQGEML